MEETCGVQVGVRIRPFNQREKDLNAMVCVQMVGPMTILLDLETQEEGKKREDKKFTFDASFWSFDGFDPDTDGYCRAKPGSIYADQQIVFDTFGKTVLDNAWAGYHCCLFAYGQTGAGKSYSMVGYGANRGIVPISCEEIFTRIDANGDAGLKFEVSISMVEIYNEQVQDLLIQPNSRPKRGLEIRESKQLGIYIDGVCKRAVNTYKAIEAVVDEGTTNRTVGSTLMNATSSRAHTVNVIEFVQLSEAAGQTGRKVSLINLVDLAGSEKAGQTGASGDRLKEGCAINKSLSALGNVIEKLADRSQGKAKANVVIPYRDSKLTRLLQNALGGSSKTVMICAISPASSNYEETLSTLRYADRAKRIKNAAVINENPADKLIRQLREENQKLREMVGGSSPSQPEQGRESEEEMATKKAEINALEQALNDMQRSFQDRLAEAKEQAARDVQAKQRDKEDLKMPHIANLNEDELLTNKLRFAFYEGRLRIGRSEGNEVCLAAPGIQLEHAFVESAGGRCKLSASSKEAAECTFVNGQSPKNQAVELAHGDRVAFGQCFFVFVDPSQGTAKDMLAFGQVSYAMARREVNEGRAEGEEELKASRARAEELERLVKQAEERKLAAQAESEELLKKREEEFKRRMEGMQAEYHAKAQKQAAAEGMAAAHATELERMQREFEDKQRRAEESSTQKIKELEAKAQRAVAEEEDHRQREANMRRLEEQLMIAMPLVKEANLIAVELKRPYRLETRMQVALKGDRTRGSVEVSAAVSKNKVRVYEWPLETLENRVYIMRELLQRCEEEGLEGLENLNQEEDPFWDPVEPERLIGVAQASLQGLLTQVELQHDCKILSTEVLGVATSRQDERARAPHQVVGSLRVEVWPCAADGTPGVPDEEIVDEPSELLGSRLPVLIHVVKASGLPEELATDPRVEFDFFIDEAPHQVPAVLGHHCSPELDYKKIFVQDPVTSRFLDHCANKTLVFRVYGSSAEAQAVKREAAEAEAAVAAAAARAAAEAVEQNEEDEADDARLRAAAGGSEGPAPAFAEPPPEGSGPPEPPQVEAPLPGAIAEEAASPPATPAKPAALEATQPTPPAPSVSQVRREADKAAAAANGAGAQKSKTCALL